MFTLIISCKLMSKSRQRGVKAVQPLSGVKTRLQFSRYRSFCLLSHEVVSRRHSVTVYKQPTADSFAPRASATRCIRQLDKWQNEDESSRLCPRLSPAEQGLQPPCSVWSGVNFSEKTNLRYLKSCIRFVGNLRQFLSSN